MATHILRLTCTSHPRTHVLIQVKQTRADSLHLKLIGTEHEHLYHATLSDSNIKSLQANFDGNLEEWRQILKYCLLHERGAGNSPQALQGLETVAAIQNNTLTITIRKNIGGITQRLGSIRLDQDDEREEVGAFEWVDTAVANADDLRFQLEALQASVSGQQEQVGKLSRQLDELVQAKKDHEAELLRKFAVLLNEKKLKIRDQQRLLNGAKVDPAVAESTSSARRGSKARGSRGSRSGKRKAEPEEDLDDEASEAFEDPEEREQERQEETPPRSDAGEETEEDDDLDVPASSTMRLEKGVNDDFMDVDSDDGLPSRKQMPPKKKDLTPPAKVPMTAAADDDDETDDEL